MNTGDVVYALYSALLRHLRTHAAQLVSALGDRLYCEEPPMDYEDESPFLLVSQSGGRPIHEMGGPPAETVELKVSIWLPVASGLAEGYRLRGLLWEAMDTNVLVGDPDFNTTATVQRAGWDNDRDGDWREFSTTFAVVLDSV